MCSLPPEINTANDVSCLRVSVISYVVNAHSGRPIDRYADALVSYTVLIYERYNYLFLFESD